MATPSQTKNQNHNTFGFNIKRDENQMYKKANNAEIPTEPHAPKQR